MKKIIVFVVLFASIGGSWLQAQDTLWLKGPKSSYYYNNWVDTTNRYVTLEGVQLGTSYILAKQFVTENTLQVYGIAAMMARGPVGGYSYEDPTFNNSEESLLLYQYHENGSPVMEQLGDLEPIHAINTTPTYWMMSNTPPISHADTYPKAVYERCFSMPQTVYDTFFAGITLSNGGFSKIDSLWHEIRPSFSCVCYSTPDMEIDFFEKVAAYRHDAMNEPVTWQFTQQTICTYFIFPILTPNPETDTTVVNDTTVVIDTTVTDTTHVDTVAVRLPEFMGRYVSVSPNPATGSAEVLSSFGLSRVEVFSAAGQKVMDRKAEGLKATLDVSKLPSGAYLLRIHTPQGMTTKKLVVR